MASFNNINGNGEPSPCGDAAKAASMMIMYDNGLPAFSSIETDVPDQINCKAKNKQYQMTSYLLWTG